MSISKVKYIISILFVIYIVGCTTTSKYEVLNFVFDGVPDPAVKDSLARLDSLKLLASTESELLVFEPKIDSTIFHPPYFEKQCDMCHDASSFGKLTQEQPDLCYNCHENFSDKYNFVHGPVEGGFCSACHNPHKTKQETLLLRTGQDLCLKCHERDLIFNSDTHSEIEETLCTECHNPHGGEDQYIFR